MKANTKIALQSWKPTFSFLDHYFQSISFLKFELFYFLNDFDLIPKLRARLKYYLSSDNKFEL